MAAQKTQTMILEQAGSPSIMRFLSFYFNG